MKTKVFTWVGLILSTVFLVTVVWEFLAEEWVMVSLTGHYEPETQAGHWHEVFTNLIFVGLSLIAPTWLIFRQIKERDQVGQLLKEREELTKALFDNASDAIITIDSGSEVTRWNRQAVALFGWSAEEAIGRKITELIVPENSHASHYKGVLTFFGTREGPLLNRLVEVSALHRDGHEIQVEITISAIEWRDSFVFLGIIRDITNRKKMEEELEKSRDQLIASNLALQELSLLDGLTGIANRRSFDAFIQKEWRRSARDGTSLSMILLDIDFFKKYNDAYGHQAGDECLKRVAAAIHETLKRPGDLVARYGGEEFAVVMPGIDLDHAMKVAERLRKNIENLAIEHSHSAVAPVVTVSLGVATEDDARNNSPESLVHRTDQMLYKAKAEGRNCIRI